jgi:hypothetical protein
VVELPKPPWYRRFGVVVLAANLVVAAVLVAAVVALWPRAAAPRPGAPATTAGVGPQAEQVLAEGPSQRRSCPPRPGPAWSGVSCGNSGERRLCGRAVRCARPLAGGWSFNCQSFAKYGGGNFKLSGAGDFAEVSVQRFGVRGRGVLPVTGGGRGRLTIESVCDRWVVKAVAP